MTEKDATARQIEAADPQHSTWLSANAGSGKTRVLTDRVARLLLGGTQPENILCLTYTKAAASEMQNRLFKRLGEWAMMPDDPLKKALSDLTGGLNVSEHDVRRARTLFAAAIDTPGGLKIQTVHSFCAGMLRRFPLEADVSPQFKEMEDRAAQLLREEVLEEMAKDTDISAVADLARHHSGADITKFLGAITSKSSHFLRPVSNSDMAKFFDVPADFTDAKLIGSVIEADDLQTIRKLVPVCFASGPNDQKAAAKLHAITNITDPNMACLDIMEDVFLFGSTAKNPFGAKINSFPTKAVREAHPELIDQLNDLMQRVEETRDLRLRWLALQRNRALFAFATPFVTRYEAKKAQRALLDFDDLIGKAKALLEDPLVAQWVLFRLDGGVDHVLVDEAQDTSPDQWDIVRLLTQEFSTGEGALPDRQRTVFVVGDKKQSIYSFQGADPEGFDQMRDHFEGELQKVQKQLKTSDLLHSFRSSQAVLGLVDQTFRNDMSDGLGTGIKHLAYHKDMPGRVDLWPVIEPSEKPEARAWDDPMDIKGPTNNKVILAKQIASEIKRMIESETLPAKVDSKWVRRKITAGDFLILVQGRQSGIFDQVISACKAAELDVAGADRLKLGGELAVKDISALLGFLSLQDDDLSLAAALKSPLFGWSEKQLYDLAQPRPSGQTLWEALRKSDASPETMLVLNDLRNQSDFLRPYDLINRLLVRHSGRHNLLARLGHEAEDGIDALLSQALDYERSSVPSLTGFLSWLQTEDVIVKRQMDTAGDRIRVMTVHGAKGLESPIVILPETTKRNRVLRDDILFAEGLGIWKPKSDLMPKMIGEVQENLLDAQDRERRRLLYVALTRAENWLIIAAAGDVGDHYDSWHATINTTMGNLDAVDHTAPFGPIKRFSRWDWDAGDIKPDDKTTSQPLFDFDFDSPLPALPDPLKTLAPSDLGGAKVMAGETHTDSSEISLAWGNIIHLLLEVLPTIKAERRRDTAMTLVQNHSDVGQIPDISDLVDEALKVLDTPSLAWIFVSGVAEVPISASLASLGGQRIFGLIDRLIVTETDVIAVDFKSNRKTPPTETDTPNGLLRQMAAYRDALRLVYPDHRVRTALLWTRTCAITELSDPVLDAALGAVTTA